MKHELQTKLNDADITCVFNVDTDTVECFNSATGREYEEQVNVFTLEAVMFQGVDIITTLSLEQVDALDMECQHSFEEVAA